MTETVRLFHPEASGSLGRSLYHIQSRVRSRREALAAEAGVATPLRVEASPLTEALVAELAISANSSANPIALMSRAMAEICTATGWPMAHGLICNRVECATTLESCGAHFAIDEVAAAPLLAICAQAIHWPGISLPDRLLLDHSMPLQAATGETRDGARQAAMRDAGIASVVAVPIVAGGDLAAAIECFIDTQDKASSETLGRLAEIARLIGAVFERSERERSLKWEANHDPLTGLPNKAAFAARLGEAFASSRGAAGSGPSIVTIALNGFKLINDGMGREFGDALIVEVAERLKQVSGECAAAERVLLNHRGSIFVSRGGGAEFAIAVEGDAPADVATAIAAAAHESFRTPFRVKASSRRLTACIGVAHSDPSHRDVDDLLREAEAALFRARECGGEATIVFDRTMRENTTRALLFEAGLREAVDNHELDLAYQPIMDLGSLRIVGVEALLRWPQPDGSILMPDTFVPIAEQCGVIEEMGSWVIRHACARLAELKKATGTPDLFISVNLSARQLLAPPFARDVAEILTDTRIDPRDLTLEITESAALINPEEAARILETLRSSGIRICLDDFGTGFSSLSHLQTLPLDGLKIDKDFVRNQHSSSQNWSIVDAIVRMGRALELGVVAEGIETTEQLEALRAFGCPFGQGYLFSRPVTVEALRSFGESEAAAAAA